MKSEAKQPQYQQNRKDCPKHVTPIEEISKYLPQLDANGSRQVYGVVIRTLFAEQFCKHAGDLWQAC